jgi:hypothetical protein
MRAKAIMTKIPSYNESALRKNEKKAKTGEIPPEKMVIDSLGGVEVDLVAWGFPEGKNAL